MIIAIGCDLVDVNRFNAWMDYSYDQLARVFSDYEIKAALQITDLAMRAQYFASRFAAKESFYKALTNVLIQCGFTQSTISFAAARMHCSVEKDMWDVPKLAVNWALIEEKIGKKLPAVQVELSISHEKSMALAFVIIRSVAS